MIYGDLILIVLAIYALCKCTWWWPRWPRGVPLFLMLHSVSDNVVDASCPNNTIRPRELEALIVRLLKGGYRFRTFTDAASDPGPRDVVLTFDDGYVDNYVELLPILRRQNVPATCFVTSRFDDPRFLSCEQLREMDASGLVEIGGHTSGHCVLTSVDLAEAREQIRGILRRRASRSERTSATSKRSSGTRLPRSPILAGERTTTSCRKSSRRATVSPPRWSRRCVLWGQTPTESTVRSFRAA